MKKIAIFMMVIIVSSIFAMIPVSAQVPNLIGVIASPSDSTCQEFTTWRIQFVTPIHLHSGSKINIVWENTTMSPDNVEITNRTSIRWIAGTMVQIDGINTDLDNPNIVLKMSDDVSARQIVVLVLTNIKNPDDGCTLDVAVQVEDSETGNTASAYTPQIKIKPRSIVGTNIGASVIPNALVMVDTFIYSLPPTMMGDVAVIIDETLCNVKSLVETMQ